MRLHCLLVLTLLAACESPAPSASASDAACAPHCAGRLCGDDGCGGRCGACPSGSACEPLAGTCRAADCAGKACGPNGIGGSCGTCAAPARCDLTSGTCLTPDCAGKACGPDGTGSSCGECPAGKLCDPAGQCVDCIPRCGGSCGDDGCGGVCGSCEDGEFCTEAAVCEKAGGPTLGRTRYPIVLAHGMMGFKKLFGAMDYFYGVKSALEDDGAQVYVTEVSCAGSSIQRGEQLLSQVLAILDESGAKKVNLIGHSQGGIDSRYVAAMRPELVASVTTVGTPHQGADLATFVDTNFSEDGLPLTTAALATEGLGHVIELLSGTSKPQDARASLYTLSARGAKEFNAQFPAGLPTTACGEGAHHAGGIAFYSWTGTAVLTNVLDSSDPWFLATSTLYSEDNDGLVGRCSAHFGRVLKDDYVMNHLDETNLLVGLTSWLEVDPVDAYREHAQRLRAAGY
ncbi:MAG: triacylglycerol lipase [Myxococcales bacterium]